MPRDGQRKSLQSFNLQWAPNPTSPLRKCLQNDSHQSDERRFKPPCPMSQSWLPQPTHPTGPGLCYSKVPGNVACENCGVFIRLPQSCWSVIGWLLFLPGICWYDTNFYWSNGHDRLFQWKRTAKTSNSGVKYIKPLRKEWAREAGIKSLREKNNNNNNNNKPAVQFLLSPNTAAHNLSRSEVW